MVAGKYGVFPPTAIAAPISPVGCGKGGMRLVTLAWQTLPRRSGRGRQPACALEARTRGAASATAPIGAPARARYARYAGSRRRLASRARFQGQAADARRAVVRPGE